MAGKDNLNREKTVKMQKQILENIKISEIIPYERNARKNDHAVKEVVKSIERTGYRTPIIIDENNIILAGHTRHKAIVKMGWKEIPFVVKYTDLTENQKQEYRIRDNKTGEIAEWDFEILEADFSAEELIDFGFNIKDLTPPEVEEDEAPPPPEIPRTVKGDIYTLGNHRVMCGDSTMIDDVEKLMDGKRADMVFTDPPYNIAYEGGSKKREMIKNDSMDDFYSFLKMVFDNYLIITKSGGAIYVSHADTERINFTKAFIDAGFKLSSVIIWVKNNATFGRSDYFWKHEPILYGWNSLGSHTWHGDRKQDTIWNIDRPSESKSHPTMKPIKLIEKAIINSSKTEDLLSDLFLGSGSTLMACEQTNRICYGMELDEKYCDVIVQRWVNFTGGKVILNGQAIEWSKTDGK